jgi:peptidoglycan hydrolase-like protein with peptidoglycan-binding domain
MIMRRLFTSATLVASLVLVGGVGGTAAAAPQGPVTHGSRDICNFTISRPTLKLGSSGPAVRQAQCYLNHSLTGPDLTLDGVFGPVTDAATKRFQACAGIVRDGVVGAQTWSFLVFWANSTAFAC